MTRATTRLFLAAVLITSGAQAQRLLEWTEQAGELGLGYPVPIPVDTPLPFDGFRSHAGLHARHQDLAGTHDVVAGEVIGRSLAGRDIWAYRLGDADSTTVTGLDEGAVLINGTIHAREWQSPEVLTAILERFVEYRDDDHLYRYLLDNLHMVLIPVLNVDGFLQTQRFPTQSYLDSNGNAPRDGRMRRKNMNGVDEVMATAGDHLLGIDLNRNLPPFFGSGIQNSASAESIVHRGAAALSEPESDALVVAAQLGPADRLRAFTDVHSFSQVQFFVSTTNDRRNGIQAALLQFFRQFQLAQPGSKLYPPQSFTPAGVGIGATDEYFAETYQIPSWTLEIEPNNGGVDYGGFGSNNHDGFILPESEIGRVRDNLSQGFAFLWYRQAGPPSVRAVTITDPANGAVVFEAEWDTVEATTRSLYRNVVQPLVPNRDYRLWVAFDKPMRWRDQQGDIVPAPGQPGFHINFSAELEFDGETLAGDAADLAFLDQPGGTPDGFLRYRDDAAAGALRIEPVGNEALPESGSVALALDFLDFTGQFLDTDPSTAADFFNGAWAGYENDDGGETDLGGTDRRITIDFGRSDPGTPFLVTPGVSGAWFDPTHDGEGFLVEVLDAGRAIVYWFTYDGEGNQRWMIAEGAIEGNVITVPELIQTDGALFGADFDPADVRRFDAGSARFLWSGCEASAMAHDVDAPRGRQALVRLSRLQALGCEDVGDRSEGEAAFSGTWYDPARDGEGFVVQSLPDGRVLVFWFTYDPEGNQAWIFGDGVADGSGSVLIENALITRGGRFGDDFDPSEVERQPWGRLEFSFSCNDGTVAYEADDPGFGSGHHGLQRLTVLPGLNCADR